MKLFCFLMEAMFTTKKFSLIDVPEMSVVEFLRYAE